MDNIWGAGSSADSKERRQKRAKAFLEDTFDVMVNAKAYSASACLLTRDIRYARKYGHGLRQLGAYVYGVEFG